MVNIAGKTMTNNDLAEIRESQAVGIAHGEYFDNSDYIKEIRRKLESNPSVVLTNKFAGDSLYVPIDVVEATLDNIYGSGNWYTQNFQFYPMGSVEVPVYNKKTKQTEIKVKALMGCSIELVCINRNFESPVWVKYVGTTSDYVSPLQGNTFLAKLKAEAFKNATKQIGNVFGRNLNRNVKDTSYAQQTATDLLQEIQDATNLAELESLMQGEGITEQIRQAVWNDYQIKWTELFRLSLKSTLGKVSSREGFENVMREFQRNHEAAKDFFKNDAECVEMLTKVAKKYPKK